MARGNTLELICEKPHFELRIPVSDRIDLELIPLGVAGGRRPTGRHRLIIPGRGNYNFHLSTRRGEAEFSIFSPEGVLLHKIVAQDPQGIQTDALELEPGEYAFFVSSSAMESVEYTLRLSGTLP